MFLIFANHVMKSICIYTCCINNNLSFKCSFIGYYFVVVIFLDDVLNCMLKLKFASVHCSIFTHSNRKSPWTDNTTCWNIQSCYCIISQIRLHLKSFFFINNTTSWNTVLFCLL